MNKKTAHPAERYAREVLNGKEPACLFVKQACQRQLDDLDDQGKSHFPFYHDRKEALRNLAFLGLCRQSKGRKWAGKPLDLLPWQQFIVWCIFGWMRDEDDYRRFGLSYTEIPRKNGKSTLAAGIGNALFLADGEPGAEVYCVANKEKQAKIIWGESKRMIEQTPELKEMVVRNSNNMNVPSTYSKYEPLGADSETQDGLNPSGVNYDELHAARNRDLWDRLTTGDGTRDQCLINVITTAGKNKGSICYEVRKEIVAILSRAVRKEDWFGYIATIDEKDDPKDPKVWRKANPSLGAFLNERVVRSVAELAEQLPSEMSKFLRYNLNVWVEGASQMLTEKLWDENNGAIDLSSLEGESCYTAIDLSSERDLTAVTHAFELADGYVALLVRVFCPEERIEERSTKDGVPYAQWRRDGFLTATPGDLVDYGAIEDCLEADRERYDIKEVSFDPRFATYLAVRLGPEGKGFKVLRHYQYFSSMNPPTRMIQKLFASKKIVHFNNPILKWCAMNTAVAENHQGELRPSKKDSKEKIDAMISSTMAVGRLFNHDEEEPQGTSHSGMVSA